MRTIALISQKGGAGKTTLAIALAVTAERAGYTSVLVDLDPQASATQWSDLREAETPIVTCTPTARLESVLTAAQDGGADIAVLDTPPHAAGAALAAAHVSDFVLIPCRAATSDLVAIGASIDLIRIADKPGAVVINAAPVANPLTGEALAAVAGYGVKACPVVVHQRVEHVHAFTSGLSACESAPNGKAASEINKLFEWIYGVMNLGKA
jgi:chromosome partitioning protein